jgi:hypothetical protein
VHGDASLLKGGYSEHIKTNLSRVLARETRLNRVENLKLKEQHNNLQLANFMFLAERLTLILAARFILLQI